MMAEGGFVDQSLFIFLSEHKSLRIDRPSLYLMKGSIWPNFIVFIENGVTGGDSVRWSEGTFGTDWQPVCLRPAVAADAVYHHQCDCGENEQWVQCEHFGRLAQRGYMSKLFFV